MLLRSGGMGSIATSAMRPRRPGGRMRTDTHATAPGGDTVSPIEIRFGGYRAPASIHNQSAAYFGAKLRERLGDRVRFELIGSVLERGRMSGDLPVMVESGELDFCYMAS